MKVIYKNIVKPMTRGQITLPAPIREKLNITAETWLWVKMLEDDQVLLEPVEKTNMSVKINNFLIKSSHNTQALWLSDDQVYLDKLKIKAQEKMKLINEKNIS